jgi:hypothetical protein
MGGKGVLAGLRECARIVSLPQLIIQYGRKVNKITRMRCVKVESLEETQATRIEEIADYEP